jgi:histidinol-phosphatase (PHP family)
MLYNYHTHTRYCDGSSAPEDYCRSAQQAGFRHIGFSGHAPVPIENGWSIRPDAIGDYFTHIHSCKGLFEGLEVFAGLEADYIPEITPGFDHWRALGAEYLIGSIHLVKAPLTDELWFIDGPPEGFDKGLKTLFNNDIQSAVHAFFAQTRQMLQTQKPDIVGHFDKVKMHNQERFFKTSDDWYRREIEETLEVIKHSGVIVELNTRGRYKGRTSEFFPSSEIIQRCAHMEIPVLISSDAHKPEELNLLYHEAVQVLKNAGYTQAMKREGQGWAPYQLY